MTKGYYHTCETCNERYYYEVTKNIWAGGKDWETAKCPYCQAEGPSEFTDGFIYTYKLDEEANPIRKSV